MITRSEDLVKLRALEKLCSQEFFNDESLLVVGGGVEEDFRGFGFGDAAGAARAR